MMHVNNVIIQAVGFAFHDCDSAPGAQLVQVGLFFNDADGTATDVTVRDITQHSGCQTGNGIRANANAGTARTVTLTHVTVTGFQKNGVTGSGQMTLNVGGNSTIGPPEHLPGMTATNSVQYGGGGAGGTFTGNTVIGSGFGAARQRVNRRSCCPAPPTSRSTNNTITGAGTDLGIAVSYQHERHDLQQRRRPHRARLTSGRPLGSGSTSSIRSATNVTLICNTFSGWQRPEHRRRSTDVVHAAAQRHRMHHLLGRHLQC